MATVDQRLGNEGLRMVETLYLDLGASLLPFPPYWMFQSDLVEDCSYSAFFFLDVGLPPVEVGAVDPIGCQQVAWGLLARLE
jgi:hypothetical protein